MKMTDQPEKHSFPASGRCECDAPATAHEVRRLRSCAYCNDLGKDLVLTACGFMHVLCAMRAQPAADVADVVLKRARLCCLMTYCDGDATKAGDVLDLLRRVARAA